MLAEAAWERDVRCTLLNDAEDAVNYPHSHRDGLQL